MLDDELRTGLAHAYLLCTTIETMNVKRTWWLGSSSDSTEESLTDTPPFSGEGFVPAGGQARISMTMRLRVGPTRQSERVDTMWFSTEATIDLDVASQGLLVRPCPPTTGALFETAEAASDAELEAVLVRTAATRRTS